MVIILAWHCLWGGLQRITADVSKAGLARAATRRLILLLIAWLLLVASVIATATVAVKWALVLLLSSSVHN